MKKIFVMLTAILTVGVHAQVVKIETAEGTKVYDLTKVASISFSDEAYEENLVEMEVVNASPLAFDLKVTKSVSCQKYMVAVQPQATFSESDFEFAAQQTLDKNAYYRPYANTLSYDSDTFSEVQLGLNSLLDGDGKAQPLVVAVYAVDDLGTVQIKTMEFTLPTTYKYESSIKMKIEVGEVAYNRFTYTISPVGWSRPAKILYGVTQPSDLKTTLAAFNAKTDAGKRDMLLKAGLGMPQAYSTRIQNTHSANASNDYIIFAIAVDDNGKLGEMVIETVTTPAVVANGTGSFTALRYTGESANEDDFYKKANFEIQTEGAVAYRLLWMVQSEYADNDYKNNLTETFMNVSAYSVWQQFSAGEHNIALDIVRQGQEYVLYGVTVDVNGNISEPINLLETFGVEGGVITTSPKEEED